MVMIASDGTTCGYALGGGAFSGHRKSLVSRRVAFSTHRWGTLVGEDVPPANWQPGERAVAGLGLASPMMASKGSVWTSSELALAARSSIRGILRRRLHAPTC